MKATEIVDLIVSAGNLAKALAPVVERGLAVAGSQDAARIHAALLGLREANDALHDKVQAKLRG